MDWSLVNVGQALRLFHVTYPHCVDGITRNGLIPARQNTDMPVGGRAEIYLKTLSPNATKQVSPRPGCTVMCVVAAEFCGEVSFYETPEGSIVTRDAIPPSAIVAIRHIKDNSMITAPRRLWRDAHDIRPLVVLTPAWEVSGKGRGEGASRSVRRDESPPPLPPPFEPSGGASHAASAPAHGEGASHSAKGKNKSKGKKSSKAGKGASHPVAVKKIEVASTASTASALARIGSRRLKITAGAVPQRSSRTNVYSEEGTIAPWRQAMAVALSDEVICNSQETRAKQDWHNAIDDYQIDNAIVCSDTESEEPPDEQQDKDFDEAVARINVQRAEQTLCDDCNGVIPYGAMSCPACGLAREANVEEDPAELVQTFDEVWSVIANAHQKRAKRMLARGLEYSQLYATFRDVRDKGAKFWKRLQNHNDAVKSGQPSKIKMIDGPPIELNTVVDMFDLTDWGVTMVRESHITRDDVAAAAFVWYFDIRTARSDTVLPEERAARTFHRTIWSSEAVVVQKWPGDEEASQDPVCIQAQNVDRNAMAVVRQSDVAAAAISRKPMPKYGLIDSEAYDHPYVSAAGASHYATTRGERASGSTGHQGERASGSKDHRGERASGSKDNRGEGASHSGEKRQRVEEVLRERQPRGAHSAPRRKAVPSSAGGVTPPWRTAPTSSATTMVRAPTLRATSRPAASSSSRAVLTRPEWLPEELESDSEEPVYQSPSEY